MAANLPAYLTGRDAGGVLAVQLDRGADLGSVWLVIQQASNHDLGAHTINAWSWLLFGAWCLGVLVLGLRAPETPRLAQLGFLVVAGFLLVNKVYSPQYVLWLLPLAVLACPRWRDQIVWQAERSSTSRRCGGTSPVSSTPPAAPTPASTGWRSCSGWPPSSTSS